MREIKLCGLLRLLSEERLMLIIFVGNNTRNLSSLTKRSPDSESGDDRCTENDSKEM
jgi:hypothetical protein